MVNNDFEYKKENPFMFSFRMGVTRGTIRIGESEFFTRMATVRIGEYESNVLVSTFFLQNHEAQAIEYVAKVCVERLKRLLKND